jgi:hypothetical protein
MPKARTVLPQGSKWKGKYDARLMSGKRQKNQLLLAFMAESRGEAPRAASGGTEPLVAKREPESLASTEQLMEEVCQRKHLEAALKRVQANKYYCARLRPFAADEVFQIDAHFP